MRGGDNTGFKQPTGLLLSFVTFYIILYSKSDLMKGWSHSRWQLLQEMNKSRGKFTRTRKRRLTELFYFASTWVY